MLFATNLALLPGETPSVITVHATDARQFTYTLQVEQLSTVVNLGWLSELIVRLPDDMTITGDLYVTVGIRGAKSNAVRVAIRAP